MKCLTFYTNSELRLGIKTERGVLDVQAATEALGITTPFRNPNEFFEQGLEALPALQELVGKAEADGRAESCYPQESGLNLGPCVTNPEKIICVGLNYLRHAHESGVTPPSTPVLFSKFNNSLAAHGDIVPLPSNASEYDYEAELVIVIGKRAKNVPEEQAMEYVLGYCNGNDVSARDLQMLTGQWLLGKTLDKFMPIGPYLVTGDEIFDAQSLPIRCWLNGELRQDSETSDMIFSIAEIISYVSRYMTLEPGDIISTGTPEGVVLGMSEKVWMKPGDEAVVEIGPLGRLVNVMGEGPA